MFGGFYCVILALTPSLYLCMQVRQPSGHRQSQTTAAQPVHSPAAQIRAQRALGKTEGGLYSEEIICKVQGGTHWKNIGGGGETREDELQAQSKEKKRCCISKLREWHNYCCTSGLPSGMPLVAMATWLEVSPQEVQAESPRL